MALPLKMHLCIFVWRHKPCLSLLGRVHTLKLLSGEDLTLETIKATLETAHSLAKRSETELVPAIDKATMVAKVEDALAKTERKQKKSCQKQTLREVRLVGGMASQGTTGLTRLKKYSGGARRIFLLCAHLWKKQKSS